MVRIFGNTGSRRRRRLQLGAIVSMVALLALLVVPNALAVHQLQFELDGNTSVDAGGPAFDWESFFNAAGAEDPVLPDASRPGFNDSGFSKDFTRTASGAYSTDDPSTYATGSKDTLSISPGWQCNRDNNVSDKVDITNAYAVTYEAPTTIPGPNPGDPNIVTAGDQILYFALERFANDGDANVAFWFLQDQVSCSSPGGNTPFVGDHHDGDVLVVSSFTKGGVVSTIDAYAWSGDDNTGSLDPTPIAHGVDCNSPVTPVNDTTCATVNTVTINPPWDNENKRGGANIRTAEFFEGGLNITAAGLTNECFATFTGDTRSSQSLTATLFDYALGELGACGVEVATQTSTGSVVLGQGTVHDTATVTGTGGVGTPPVPTGKVKFFVCQPSELDGNGECSQGGTQVGEPPEGEDLSPTGNPSEASAQSDEYTPTVLGTHCWRAEYSGDDNYDATNEFSAATECFTVTGTASLSTAQDWLPNDTATITGDASLNGTLTFTLYSGDNCGVTSGSAVYTEPAITLTNAGTSATRSTTNGTDPNNTFKVTAANDGVAYSWLVHYDDTTLSDPADVCETSTGPLTLSD